jgi:hypothetical protein
VPSFFLSFYDKDNKLGALIGISGIIASTTATPSQSSLTGRLKAAFPFLLGNNKACPLPSQQPGLPA